MKKRVQQVYVRYQDKDVAEDVFLEADVEILGSFIVIRGGGVSRIIPEHEIMFATVQMVEVDADG